MGFFISFKNRVREVRKGRKISKLTFRLRNDNPPIRRHAVEVFGEIKDLQAIEPLIASLRGGHSYFKSYMAGALQAITGVNIGPDFFKWERWWEAYKDKIRSEG